jgi:hypothetical protein
MAVLLNSMYKEPLHVKIAVLKEMIEKAGFKPVGKPKKGLLLLVLNSVCERTAHISEESVCI